MPPKHDLRGGNASVDSFAMSINVLTTSMSRCFLAGGRQRFRKDGNDNELSHRSLAQIASHRSMGVVSEERLT